MGKSPEKENPPILRIKRGAEIDKEYHYDRERRLSMPSASHPGEIRGFFRTFLNFGGGARGSRRGVISSLLPVLIIVLAAIMVFRFVGRPADQAAISRFSVTLRASPYKDSLQVSVSFAPRTGGARPAPSEPVPATATVRFILPDTGQELIVSDPVVEEGFVLRGRMQYTGKEKSLKAEIRVGKETKTLSTAVRPPALQP